MCVARCPGPGAARCICTGAIAADTGCYVVAFPPPPGETRKSERIWKESDWGL